ncbi:hypothetical protein E2320_015655 [Naja naja]|nr:hypothetical protein E2320_015655 [Naja naja]
MPLRLPRLATLPRPLLTLSCSKLSVSRRKASTPAPYPFNEAAQIPGRSKWDFAGRGEEGGGGGRGGGGGSGGGGKELAASATAAGVFARKHFGSRSATGDLNVIQSIPSSAYGSSPFSSEALI